MCFFCPIRVRYNEVDKQGIVYNGNYVIYTDVAFEEYLASKGHPYGELVGKYDAEVCHKKSTYEYISSAYEGEIIEVGVYLMKMGTRSFTMGFEIYKKGEDELITKVETTFVGYDVVNRTSREIVPILREMLEG